MSSVTAHGKAGAGAVPCAVSAPSVDILLGEGGRAGISLYFTFAGTEAQRSDLIKVI